jgi:hypothetical protein
LEGKHVYGKLNATSKDVVTMNLTIAALHRWLSNLENNTSGKQIGREIGAMYREIYEVVAEMSVGDNGDDLDDEDDEDDEEYFDEDDEDDEDDLEDDDDPAEVTRAESADGPEHHDERSSQDSTPD